MFQIIWPDHINILKLLTTPTHALGLTKNYKMSNACGCAHPPGVAETNDRCILLGATSQIATHSLMFRSKETGNFHFIIFGWGC